MLTSCETADILSHFSECARVPAPGGAVYAVVQACGLHGSKSAQPALGQFLKRQILGKARDIGGFSLGELLALAADGLQVRFALFEEVVDLMTGMPLPSSPTANLADVSLTVIEGKTKHEDSPIVGIYKRRGSLWSMVHPNNPCISVTLEDIADLSPEYLTRVLRYTVRLRRQPNTTLVDFLVDHESALQPSFSPGPSTNVDSIDPDTGLDPLVMDWDSSGADAGMVVTSSTTSVQGGKPRTEPRSQPKVAPSVDYVSHSSKSAAPRQSGVPFQSPSVSHADDGEDESSILSQESNKRKPSSLLEEESVHMLKVPRFGTQANAVQPYVSAGGKWVAVEAPILSGVHQNDFDKWINDLDVYFNQRSGTEHPLQLMHTTVYGLFSGQWDVVREEAGLPSIGRFLQTAPRDTLVYLRSFVRTLFQLERPADLALSLKAGSVTTDDQALHDYVMNVRNYQQLSQMDEKDLIRTFINGLKLYPDLQADIRSMYSGLSRGTQEHTDIFEKLCLAVIREADGTLKLLRRYRNHVSELAKESKEAVKEKSITAPPKTQGHKPKQKEPFSAKAPSSNKGGNKKQGSSTQKPNKFSSAGVHNSASGANNKDPAET